MNLAAHTAQPGSLPRILQQTLCPGWGFSSPGPCAGPRDLIVLKHSSYRHIFQYPLSLVSDLHICWSTVGCSLCSSDQLGISLALRGSGLCSHLSDHHLPGSLWFFHLIFLDCCWPWVTDDIESRMADKRETTVFYCINSFHSTVGGRLGCFQFGTLTISATMFNILGHIFWCSYICMSGVELQDLMMCTCSALVMLPNNFPK